jgi:hypothetical protein
MAVGTTGLRPVLVDGLGGGEMSESKMREALESAAKALQMALPYMQTDESGAGPDCSSVIQAIIDCETIAQQPAAVVELTDDEIESVAHRSCSIYVHGRDQIDRRFEFGRLTLFDFATKLIQTYRAKQGGVV